MPVEAAQRAKKKTKAHTPKTRTSTSSRKKTNDEEDNEDDDDTAELCCQERARKPE